MTNKASDEWIDELLKTFETGIILGQVSPVGAITARARHDAKQTIRKKLQEAQHNCNVADDQPNDVHIKYFNEGYKKGVADTKADDAMSAKIVSMGSNFRSLILHSNGKYTVNLRRHGIKYWAEADTPELALAKAEERLAQLTNTSGKESDTIPTGKKLTAEEQKNLLDKLNGFVEDVDVQTLEGKLRGQE